MPLGPGPTDRADISGANLCRRSSLAQTARMPGTCRRGTLSCRSCAVRSRARRPGSGGGGRAGSRRRRARRLGTMRGTASGCSRPSSAGRAPSKSSCSMRTWSWKYSRRRRCHTLVDACALTVGALRVDRSMVWASHCPETPTKPVIPAAVTWVRKQLTVPGLVRRRGSSTASGHWSVIGSSGHRASDATRQLAANERAPVSSRHPVFHGTALSRGHSWGHDRQRDRRRVM
jgi:hypothetical protein